VSAVLTRALLERRLWAAAEALRGAVDAADFRGVILGAVFLKRLSDVFDEERAAGHPHDFVVPATARWAAVTARATGIGRALERACAAVERANPSLAGTLTGIGFDSAHRLGPRAQRDVALRGLVAALDPLPLGNASLAEPDVLGRAYEYLIGRFADDAGRKGGEFYTPRGVVQLLVAILDPRAGMRVCDPTCGSGGMLVEVATQLRARGEDPRALTLHGQEKNAATWAICRMNLLLHGLPAARVELGDTLRAPKLLEGKVLCRYDAVIANPPFSLADWGRDEAARDPHRRFAYGLPSRARGDLAFVQHMLATLDEGGVAAVVLPQGALFRGGAEARARAAMLRAGVVDAVIALPGGLFHGTPIPSSVLVLRKGNAVDAPVLLVDASNDYAPGAPQNTLRPRDIARITAALRAGVDAPGYARLVPAAVLAEGDAALAPGRWVGDRGRPPEDDLAAALAALTVRAEARDRAEAAMRAALALEPLT
jgi:type I restriction enzyme M protein